MYQILLSFHEITITNGINKNKISKKEQAPQTAPDKQRLHDIMNHSMAKYPPTNNYINRLFVTSLIPLQSFVSEYSYEINQTLFLCFQRTQINLAFLFLVLFYLYFQWYLL